MTDPSDSGADAEADPSGGETPGRRARSDGGAAVHADAASVDGGFSTGRIDAVLDVGRRELRVLRRARWPVGIGAAFALLSVTVVLLGSSSVGPGGAGAVLLTLGELSVYLVPLAALVLGYGTVVGAEERGSLEMLLALPIDRSSVAAGLFLGRAAALATGLTLGLAAGGAVFAAAYGPLVVPAYLNYLLAAVAVGAGCLAVGVCISALASEKARALAGALVVWVWFVFVYDMVALGAVVSLNLPKAALTALVVANPVDLLRIVVLSLVPSSGGGVGATLATTTVPLPAVLVGAAAWIGLPVAAAGWLLGRRHR